MFQTGMKRFAMRAEPLWRAFHEKFVVTDDHIEVNGDTGKYTITFQHNEPECSCPSFNSLENAQLIPGRQDCKHTLAVRAQLEVLQTLGKTLETPLETLRAYNCAARWMPLISDWRGTRLDASAVPVPSIFQATNYGRGPKSQSSAANRPAPAAGKPAPPAPSTAPVAGSQDT